jgi:hypothetical protein
MNQQESSNFQPLVMANRTASDDRFEELFDSLHPTVLTENSWPCFISSSPADPEEFLSECVDVCTDYWVGDPLATSYQLQGILMIALLSLIARARAKFYCGFA